MSRSGTTPLSASSKLLSRSDTTACADSPAQPVSTVPLSSNHRGRNVTATACAVSPAQSHARSLGVDSNVIDIEPKYSNRASPSDATACAASPAQALPRDVVRGQNPNDRSPYDRTDSAASPAQPAVPQKPKPDADGLIWHPDPGYPNQEMGYKIRIRVADRQDKGNRDGAQARVPAPLEGQKRGFYE
jgi:hypothetical protein